MDKWTEEQCKKYLLALVDAQLVNGNETIDYEALLAFIKNK